MFFLWSQQPQEFLPWDKLLYINTRQCCKTSWVTLFSMASSQSRFFLGGGGDICSWVGMNILLLRVLSSVSTLLLWPCIKLGYGESDSIWLNKSQLGNNNKYKIKQLMFLRRKKILNIITTSTKKPICFVTEPTNFSSFV